MAKVNFTQVATAITESEALTIAEKGFYLVLKSFLNRKTTQCFPSMQKVCERTGISKNTAKAYRKKLKDSGFLDWHEAVGRGHSCHYVFPLENKRVNLGPLLNNKRVNERPEKGQNLTLNGFSEQSAKNIEKKEGYSNKSENKRVNLRPPNHINHMNNHSRNSDELRLSQFLLDLILERRDSFKKPNLTSWAKQIDLMIRVDKRGPDEIERVISWCQQDDFWQDNILSTSKLRKQFDQLSMKMLKDQLTKKKQVDDEPPYWSND